MTEAARAETNAGGTVSPEYLRRRNAPMRLLKAAALANNYLGARARAWAPTRTGGTPTPDHKAPNARRRRADALQASKGLELFY